MKRKQAAVSLNDIGFRLILIPFFGIAIPLVTGMINPQNYSHWQIKLSFLCTILTVFIIWQGNRYLLFTMRSYFNWYKKPVKKIKTYPKSKLLLEIEPAVTEEIIVSQENATAFKEWMEK